MTISFHIWTPDDKPALMALCNAIDRTFAGSLYGGGGRLVAGDGGRE